MQLKYKKPKKSISSSAEVIVNEPETSPAEEVDFDLFNFQNPEIDKILSEFAELYGLRAFQTLVRSIPNALSKHGFHMFFRSSLVTQTLEFATQLPELREDGPREYTQTRPSYLTFDEMFNWERIHQIVLSREKDGSPTMSFKGGGRSMTLTRRYNAPADSRPNEVLELRLIADNLQEASTKGPSIDTLFECDLQEGIVTQTGNFHEVVGY